MSSFRRLIKNSIANIINGFSNVIMGIIISPFLIKNLSINDFSIWSLVLQIGAFFSLLGFSGQLSVARYITLAKSENDKFKVLEVLKFGNVVSFLGVLFSVIILYVVYSNFFDIFGAINQNESEYAPRVFSIVSLSFIFSLLVSVYNGYFTGIERNEIPAAVNLISRIILGFGICISVKYGMLNMALTYLIVNVTSYLIVYFLYLNVKDSADKEQVGVVNRLKFREFINYCFGVLVFNLSSFLIVNLNGILIGSYAFRDYAYYALSVTLVTAVVGFLNAALAPVLQPIVKIVHLKDQIKLDNFVYLLSKIILVLSFTLLIGNLLIGKFVLNLWVGDTVSSQTYPVFIFLLLVNLSRLIGAPLGLVYLAKGKQNEIIYLPLLEGIISVLMTIFFVHAYGMYASAISMGISTIIVMVIYSYLLIDIAALKINRKRYRLLMAGGPIFLLVTTSILTKIKFIFDDYSYQSVFNVMLGILILISGAWLFKGFKSLKYILEA